MTTAIQHSPENPPAERSAAIWVAKLGPLIVALYFLATSKWGSYLIPGPPYVGDLMLLALIANRILLAASKRSLPAGRDATVALLGCGLLTWTLIRLGFGELSVNAARDAAPYIYVVIAFLVLPLNGRDERIADRLITWALVFHAAWITATLLFGELRSGQLPGAPNLAWAPDGGIYVFDLRPDIDAIALALLAAVCLNRALLGRAPTLNLALVAWALALSVVGLENRAGFIAVVLQLAIVAALAPVRSRMRDRRQDHGPAPGGSRLGDPRVAVAILIVAIPFGVYASQNTTIARSIPLGLQPNESHPFSGLNSDATARARLRSWNRLVGWVTADPGRVSVGVGFGPNYFLETGAARLLDRSAGEELRSAHNYWLNTWSRLGLVGLLLAAAIWLAAVRLAFLVARRADELSDTDLIAILLACTLPITASFGVVLESPFGAIPYFWAIGHLSCRACQIGAVPTFRSSLRLAQR